MPRLKVHEHNCADSLSEFTQMQSMMTSAVVRILMPSVNL